MLHQAVASEVSCYEASRDTLRGSFPAGCSPMRGAWSAAESHAAWPAPRGPAHSSGVLSWHPSLPRHRAAAAPGEKPHSIAVLPGKGMREQPHWGGGTPLPRRGPVDCVLSSPPARMGGRSCFPLPGHEPSGKETLLWSKQDRPHGWTGSSSLTQVHPASGPSLWKLKLSPSQLHRLKGKGVRRPAPLQEMKTVPAVSKSRAPVPPAQATLTTMKCKDVDSRCPEVVEQPQQRQTHPSQSPGRFKLGGCRFTHKEPDC